MKYKNLISLALFSLCTTAAYAISETGLAPATQASAQSVSECGSLKVSMPSSYSVNHVVSYNNSTDSSGPGLYQFLYFNTTAYPNTTNPNPSASGSIQAIRLCAGGTYQLTFNATDTGYDPDGHWEHQQIQFWAGTGVANAGASGNHQLTETEIDTGSYSVNGSISYTLTVPPLAQSTAPYYLYIVGYALDSGDNHTNYQMTGTGTIFYYGNGAPY